MHIYSYIRVGAFLAEIAQILRKMNNFSKLSPALFITYDASILRCLWCITFNTKITFRNFRRFFVLYGVLYSIKKFLNLYRCFIILNSIKFIETCLVFYYLWYKRFLFINSIKKNWKLVQFFIIHDASILRCLWCITFNKKIIFRNFRRFLFCMVYYIQ